MAVTRAGATQFYRSWPGRGIPYLNFHLLQIRKAAIRGRQQEPWMVNLTCKSLKYTFNNVNISYYHYKYYAWEVICSMYFFWCTCISEVWIGAEVYTLTSKYSFSSYLHCTNDSRRNTSRSACSCFAVHTLPLPRPLLPVPAPPLFHCCVTNCYFSMRTKEIGR